MLFELDAEIDDAAVDAADPAAAAGRCPHETRLLRWARAVCANYGVDVADVGPSFADGRALCALVHAYAPHLLPLRLVQTPPALLACPSAPAEWQGVRGVRSPHPHAYALIHARACRLENLFTERRMRKNASFIFSFFF